MITDTLPVVIGWAAAVWRRPAGDYAFPTELVGSATLVSRDMLLTCAHVCGRGDGNTSTELVVTFPQSDRSGEVFALRTLPEVANRPHDIAALHLDREAPTGPAPLHLDLRSEVDRESGESNGLTGAWAAHGYPGTDLRKDRSHRATGYPVAGTIHGPGGEGHILLSTGPPSKKVVTGFSGSGLWSIEQQAVIGIIDASDQNSDHLDVTAVGLHQAKLSIPSFRRLVNGTVLGVDEVARQAWNLDDDPELSTHWRPSARGGNTKQIRRGDRFRGRTAALTAIADWLQNPADPNLLVVTGMPGVGKSAVVGRVVTTGDPVLHYSGEFKEKSPIPTGSVSAAVHAKGKTPEAVADLIAEGAGLGRSNDLRELGSKIAQAWSTIGSDFTVVIDAIDESEDPLRLLNQVIVPIQDASTETVKMRVLLGSRKLDKHGADLLAPLPTNAIRIDLDEPEFFEREDLVGYVEATLRGDGAEKPGNPYVNAAFARPVAETIVEIAQSGPRHVGNFLVAGLIARPRAEDSDPIDPDLVPRTPDVASALEAYLNRLPPSFGIESVSARALLATLALAESPGWTCELWSIAGLAVHRQRAITTAAVEEFAERPMIRYLLDVTGDPDPSYRLFHEKLAETLLEDFE